LDRDSDCARERELCDAFSVGERWSGSVGDVGIMVRRRWTAHAGESSAMVEIMMVLRFDMA
jgi:hypothetical protein